MFLVGRSMPHGVPQRLSPRSAVAVALMAALALPLLVPSTASGARVFREGSSFDPSRLLYVADQGEANNLAMTTGQICGQLCVESIEIRDNGAVVSAGGGCSARSSTTASCSSFRLIAINVTLGDRGDRADLSGVPGRLGALIDGGGENDSLLGGPGNDQVLGGSGDFDSVDGGLGADLLSGGPGGNDFVLYSRRSEGVTLAIDDVADDGAANEGDNVMSDIEHIIGSRGNDTLRASDGANQIRGNLGNDFLDGRGGNDFLDGEGGADTMVGGPANDVVSYFLRVNNVIVTLDDAANDGEAGERDNVSSDVETVSGGAGNDVLSGSGGANTLQGFGGHDTLNGNAGNDTLDPGLGIDTLNGGIGIDLVTYQTRTSSVMVTLDGNADDGAAAPPGEGDNVQPDVENIRGGLAKDVLIGDDDPNFLEGLAGPDNLHGRGGDDTFDGGPGNDLFIGGDGVDLVTYFSRSAPLRITLDGNADDGESGENDNLAPDVERVNAGQGSDTVVGSDQANTILGHAGDDSINGAGGADSLQGLSGNDSITGGPGRDTLSGADGDDVLRAADGEPDQLFCGKGAGDIAVVDPPSVGDVVSTDCESVATSGSVGAFVLRPSEQTVSPRERVKLALTWIHPGRWRDLETVQLRITNDTKGPIFWVRFDEATNTIALFKVPPGKFGRGRTPGSKARLQTRWATLFLSEARVVGAGPEGPSVTLTLPVSFKPKAAGDAYRIEVAATDDFGNAQGFAQTGTLVVTGKHGHGKRKAKG
jgi:Ca2+-binding RTX toxin-like protein